MTNLRDGFQMDIFNLRKRFSRKPLQVYIENIEAGICPTLRNVRSIELFDGVPQSFVADRENQSRYLGATVKNGVLSFFTTDADSSGNRTMTEYVYKGNFLITYESAKLSK